MGPGSSNRARITQPSVKEIRMYRKILVGYDGTEVEDATPSLSRGCSAAIDGAVIVARACTPRAAGPLDPRLETLAYRSSGANLWPPLGRRVARGLAPVPHDPRPLPRPRTSRAERRARSRSRRRGLVEPSRARPGSGRQHGRAPLERIPVPRRRRAAGLRGRGGGTPRVIGVAYDGSEESQAALGGPRRPGLPWSSRRPFGSSWRSRRSSCAGRPRPSPVAHEGTRRIRQQRHGSPSASRLAEAGGVATHPRRALPRR